MGFFAQAACRSAVGRVCCDTSGSLLGACSAGLAASGPTTPCGLHAVDRTFLNFAAPTFLQSWATVAAVGLVSGDAPCAFLCAVAARLRATAPTAPAADRTVYRTCVGVTTGLLREGRAARASMLRISGNASRARLCAAAAAFRASAPASPATDRAIDSAWVRVASLLLCEGWTARPAMRGISSDAPRSRPCTASASPRTAAPAAPAGHRAVHSVVRARASPLPLLAKARALAGSLASVVPPGSGGDRATDQVTNVPLIGGVSPSVAG